MSSIADFFVATPAEAGRYGSMDDDAWEANRQLERAEWKSLYGLLVEFLWADLRGERWDVNRHRLATVAHGDVEREEFWSVERFPTEFVDLLATASPERVAGAVAVWQAREEMPGWDAGDHHAVVADLQRLARSAQAAGKGLYLYSGG